MMGPHRVSWEIDTFWSVESGGIDIAQVLAERGGDREIHQ
jgi:hypothetical protein